MTIAKIVETPIANLLLLQNRFRLTASFALKYFFQKMNEFRFNSTMYKTIYTGGNVIKVETVIPKNHVASHMLSAIAPLGYVFGRLRFQFFVHGPYSPGIARSMVWISASSQ